MSEKRPPRRARVPALVLALVALHTALLACFTVLYPPYLGYDEPQHVDMVVALQSGAGWDAPGERVLSLGVSRTSDPWYDFGFRPALPRPYEVGATPPRGDRPSLEDAGGARDGTGDLPNQQVQHPPLYYATGALVLELVPGSEGWSYDRTVAVLRLLSVLMLAPLPLLGWAAARRLVGAGPVAVAAGALTMLVPGLARIGGSFNNDVLLVLATSGLLVALCRVVTGDLSRRTAAAAGALLTVALLAKGFALALPVVVVAAYAIAAARAGLRAVLAPLALSLALGAVGLAWWVRNLVLYGAVQPNGFGPEVAATLVPPPRAPGTELDTAAWLLDIGDKTVTRFWGALGVPDPPTFDLLTALLLTGVLAVGVVAALGRRALRPAWLVLLLPTALVAAPLVLSSYAEYERSLRLSEIQGRYLYGGVVGLAVLAAAGFGLLLRSRRSALPLLAVVAVLGVQVFGIALVVDDLWVGSASLLDGWDRIVYTSPWPTAVTALPFVLLVAAAGSCVALALPVRSRPLPQTRRPVSRAVA